MMCYKREQQNPIGLLYNITKTKKKKTLHTVSHCCTFDTASSRERRLGTRQAGFRRHLDE